MCKGEGGGLNAVLMKKYDNDDDDMYVIFLFLDGLLLIQSRRISLNVKLSNNS